MKELITENLLKEGFRTGVITSTPHEYGVMCSSGRSFGINLVDSESEGVKHAELSSDALATIIKREFDIIAKEYEREYFSCYRDLVKKIGLVNGVCKTLICFDDGGKEFDLGRAQRREMDLIPLTKEAALSFFDAGKRVYFVYPNNRTYQCNCRKVCRDRKYLEDHYDVYGDFCGIKC
jgi:hypothetical protein